MEYIRMELECYKKQINDEEGDVVKCQYNGDGCVKIDTSNWNHITLNIDNLIEMINTIQEQD